MKDPLKKKTISKEMVFRRKMYRQNRQPTPTKSYDYNTHVLHHKYTRITLSFILTTSMASPSIGTPVRVVCVYIFIVNVFVLSSVTILSMRLPTIWELHNFAYKKCLLNVAKYCSQFPFEMKRREGEEIREKKNV